MVRSLPLLALLSVLLGTAACGGQPPAIVLATTTSVANSGLLDRLLPRYEEQTGVRVRVLPVGSGRALRLLEVGEAEVAITHAPQQESTALGRHPDWTYRKVFYNDFLIAGPPDDPATVAKAPDILGALQRIASHGSRWVSRGDESGTHEREKELWRLAGAHPDSDRLVISGQGMGNTLRVASEMGAYTLTDRGTFEQLAPQIRLKELYTGDTRLLNTYAILTTGSTPPANRFAEWVSDGEGRGVLAGLIANGTLRGFSLWPSDRPRDRPDALPF
jgi:tungstate transport system substrate-binding protein